jgi:hypothetical protein
VPLPAVLPVQQVYVERRDYVIPVRGRANPIHTNT